MKKHIASDLEKVLVEVAGEFHVSVQEVRAHSGDIYLHSKTMPIARGCRDKVIERLRRLAYPNHEIAAVLGLPYQRVGGIAARLVKEGKIDPLQRGPSPLSEEERQELEEQVLKLRGEGHSRQEMAQKMGIRIGTVSQVIAQLIAAGKLKQQHRRPKVIDPRDEEREEQIVKLRGEGRSNPEIVDELKLSAGKLSQLIRRLLRAGRINDIRVSAAVCDWRKIDDPTVQTIVSMVREDRTLREIAAKLGGVTRERVRQIINLIEQRHGEKVFESEELTWSIKEAAATLHVSPWIIKYLCANGEVPYRQRGKAGWLIGEAGMEALRQHPRVTRERACAVCGNTFDHGGTTVLTCSEGCAKQWEYQRRRNNIASGGGPLRGWHKDLRQRLLARPVCQDEKWLTLKEAAKKSGLSKTQLWWLGRRRVIASHYDPMRIARRTGKPMTLYAASEMDIARQVYEKWKKKEARKKKKKKAKRAK